MSDAVAANEVLSFRVDAVAPSKENYRRRGGGRRAQSERQWTRIKHFEELVGWRCRQAARPGQLKRLFGQQLSVEVLMYRQKVDLDNVKALIDGMKNVVYPDDSALFVKRLEVIDGDGGGGFDEPCIVVRVSPWE